MCQGRGAWVVIDYKDYGCKECDCTIGLTKCSLDDKPIGCSEPGQCKYADVFAIPTEDDGLTFQPHLSLNKTGLICQVQAGQLLTYTLTYANHGNEEAKDVVLTETYDPRTLYHTASLSPTVDNNVWEIGSLPPGGSDTISVMVRVIEDVPGDATLVNKAMLSGDDLSTEVAIVYTAVYPSSEAGQDIYLPLIFKNQR
jgi:uncharacterized repeat protein (TIGR01451 family)